MEIKLLTYNTAMLPSPFGIKKEERAKGLVKKILKSSKYNILCLQEVFDEDIREVLKHNLSGEYPFIVEKVSDNDLFNEDSGLFFASQFPILGKPKFWEFRAKKFFTADSLTDKGIFAACLKLDDGDDEKALFVFNTHLQSTMAYHETRVMQLSEIRRFTQRVLKGNCSKKYEPLKRSAILCGDFNVVGDRGEEYTRMLSLLGYPRDVYRELNKSAGYTWNPKENLFIKDKSKNDRAMQRLDYIFALDIVPYADNNYEMAKEDELNKVICKSCELTMPKATEIKGLQDGYDLSDHFGVGATICI